MAKSKKQGLLNGLNKGNALPPSVATETPISAENASMTEKCNENSVLNSDQVMQLADVNSPMIPNNNTNISNDSMMNNLTPETTNSSRINTNQSNASLSTESTKPCTPNQKMTVNNEFNESALSCSGTLNTSNTVSTSPLSSSISSSSLNTYTANYYLNPAVLSKFDFYRLLMSAIFTFFYN